MGQQVMLNQQTIAQIMRETGQQWKPCARKQYCVFAVQMPAGLVFANKLEQPESYSYIKKRFNKVVVEASKLTQADVAALQKEGCYQTDGTKITLCGTRGELWTVKPEKLMQSYLRPDGAQITEIPKQWTKIMRPASNTGEQAIQIPTKYIGVLQLSWGTLYMNHPSSKGHFTGDILVMGQDGSCSPINNEVFASTFNLSVGGWANSGMITPAGKLKELTLDIIKQTIGDFKPADKKVENKIKYPQALRIISERDKAQKTAQYPNELITNIIKDEKSFEFYCSIVEKIYEAMLKTNLQPLRCKHEDPIDWHNAINISLDDAADYEYKYDHSMFSYFVGLIPNHIFLNSASFPQKGKNMIDKKYGIRTGNYFINAYITSGFMKGGIIIPESCKVSIGITCMDCKDNRVEFPIDLEALAKSPKGLITSDKIATLINTTIRMVPQYIDKAYEEHLRM